MKKYLYTLWVLVIAVCSYAQDPAYPTAPAAPQNITAAEYFIDTDPGIGVATPLSISAATNISNASVAINVNGLSNGVHHLYIRTRSNNGPWSITATKDFLYETTVAYPTTPAAPQNIIAAEYFIDTDPGIGAGTAISITPGVNLNNITTSINTASLSNGTHQLYLRTKNTEGRWSLTNMKDFLVNMDAPYPPTPAAPQHIIAAEYFIDTDPGAGSGTAISITPGVDLNNTTTVINTTGLSTGIHRLYMRTKSAEGHWSLTNEKDFAVSAEIGYPTPPAAPQNIIAAEYFLDTDPGPGNGTPITITPGQDITDQNIIINTAGKADGNHFLYIRTKNQEGRWGLTTVRQFDISDTARVPSWSISPAGGHDYGTVSTGTPSVFNFMIHNTGNTPVTLRTVQSTNTAFVPTFTANTTIDAGDSLLMPVRFTPTAVTTYSAQLRIIATTSEFDSVTTQLSGTGFTPGTPPTLKFPTTSPYSNAKGVNATAGQTGDYTYKILYQSSTNRAPQAGYPRLGIDRNGDHDFDDAGDQMFTMVKESAGTDYAAGVVYTYTVHHPDFTNTLGYQFFAIDDQGNTAASANTAYYTGPIITFQMLDLKIFASDISFSKPNPLVNESFTMTATVTNSSAFTANNVPVKFYRDTILLGSDVIPVVNAFSTASITHTFSFPIDGFYPIKVWIDSSNTLGDANMLNNYAIRPVNVGNVTLPGGINITPPSISIQSCPQTLVLTGSAEYFGTSSPTKAAGAQVTIVFGGQTYMTTTDGAGNFMLSLQHPPCGGTQNFTISVTDFTFTSKTTAGSVNITCEDPNACIVQPRPGVNVTASLSSNPCGRTQGSTGSVDITVTYRARNLSNFWCSWDQILKDTVRIYYNGALIETHGSADGTTSPGSTKTFHVNITLDTAGPNVLEARQSYIYNEFFEIPSYFYKGMFYSMSGYGSTSMVAEPNLPDLNINSFQQPTFTSFRFTDANLKCGNAASHKVQLWDSIPGSAKTMLREYTVAGLSGMTQTTLTFSNPAIQRGTHFFTIVTDAEHAVTESDENNNTATIQVFIPKPDLTLGKLTPTHTDLSPGSTVSFEVWVRNSGTVAGASKVQFSANGVPFGNKILVSGVPEKDSVKITSDVFTVTTEDKDCPVIITATADIDTQVDESAEGNNISETKLGSDLSSYMLPSEPGSASNPVTIRSNGNQEYHPLIRNIGTRDVRHVSVKYTLGGTTIGTDSVPYLKAGEIFAVPGAFRHLFTTPGTFEIKVAVDTANTICENDESNNIGSFFVRVVESNPDFEVLSQYISPSSLNPNPGQSITIVGTVKNVGLKTSTPNVLRFLVDGVQLGNDVPFNALLSGQDTTVAATALFSSIVPGVKIMEIQVDPGNTATEEQKGNNLATRALIVGDAPDMARQHEKSIFFNPSGFSLGDTVLIKYAIRNNGAQQGAAWVRFSIYDDIGALTAIDSVPFTLAAGATDTISKRMAFSVNSGRVIADIVNCSPTEFDLLNNRDTVPFSAVVMLKSALSISGDLDMRKALPQQLPEWIGGKLVLGDNDLTVDGKILNADSTHFIVTNGAGRLRIRNNEQANTFPVGTSISRPSFARITNTGTSDNFSVRVVPYVLKNGTSGDPVNTEGVRLTWLIEEETPGGSNASVRLYWKQADQMPGFVISQSRIAHYTTKWDIGVAGAGTVDSTNGQYSWEQNGYTSFSPFTVTSGLGSALPLHLLSFDVIRQGSTAVVSWQTTNEVNSSRFIIQHSTDGQHFTDIATVAAENTPGAHNYSFIHDNLINGVNYYRLRMIDLYGSSELSPIKAIRWESLSTLQVFPNPAHAFINVKGLSTGGILQLISLDGKMLQQYITNNSTLTIDISHLAAGAYIINYNDHGKIQQQKIIKQ